MSDDNPKLLAKSTQDTVDLWRNGLLSGRHVQVINFHATPSYRRDEYRRQLEACAKHYSSMNVADLGDFFAGRWTKPKPGLIPVVFEGFRDGIDVMLPIVVALFHLSYGVLLGATYGKLVDTDEAREHMHPQH